MQEVEIRARLTKDQQNSLPEKLKRMGAKLKSYSSLTDTYFCPKSVKKFSEIEMDKVGSYSLRIRNQNHQIDNNAELNVKVINKKGDHNSWGEHEIKFDSLTDAEAILDTIGFKPYFKIVKDRTKYIYKEFTIELENIKDFDTIIEVELLVDEAEDVQAKLKIQKLLEDFGINNSQLFPKSVTNYLMHKWAKF
jgi:predicted adenylyl cyclase CyaB